ncbi:NAD-dependent epimerase/dehydratase [Desulfarculus baarsii DSM 2075]|uniref:NAD-dependent epimerase/dehydratase n=1 Tax=Desulfarculus baarsii (strain ATCC 33931 / DSM 2075 / LMG 7858 / VKM B-1802 / 2st14) TaxID=644282 RepID=E1QDK6_DESB2|nr:NAD-dependent epimerase/dehydratase family protein [Desulfarculus baarsii]ADK83525.1 NAD-dependent epimerase/dehydratase [Desulfarculus baarsii DSM 2075]
MKILLTGGAGFIGSHVAEAFLGQGHAVTIVDDLSSGRPENAPAGAELAVMDIASPQAAELMASGGFDVLCHHAAQISVPFSVEDPQADARVNILGLLNLLEAGRRGGLRRVIFISSGGAVYGEIPDAPADEQRPALPLSPYAVSKLCGETYLAYYAANFGLEALTLRYANVYGPRQTPHGEAGVVAIFMNAIAAGRPPAIYRHPETPRGMERDYVYVADCAQANVLALSAPPGVYNIATGLATTTLDLWLAVRRAAQSDLGHSFGPARAGDLRRSVLDAAKAASILGWRPERDLAAGLAETWAWRRALEAGA